ncbi:MAG: 1,4-dihydroxy-2-naphthoate octaprenyltransferase [Chitinivibrionales bacterium]|nr:1,4-dihydroxy-2-naphthoate octaprenyltransferase [Chitinivibrionales bacterium]
MNEQSAEIAEVKTRTAAVPLLKKLLITLRPWAFPASVSPVLVGLALSFYTGHPINWLFFVLCLIGVLCFHAAANMLNDVFDHRRGLDTVALPLSGGIVRGWFSERQVFWAAMVFIGVGSVCGLYLFHRSGWIIVALGLTGACIALGYTRTGRCFKYIGLGDLAIFCAFGILPVFGTWWVQTKELNWLPVLWSFPVASFTVGILHANNWHDINSDAAKQCRTFAAVLGEKGSAVYYQTLMIGPFLFIALLAALGRVERFSIRTPLAVLIVFLLFPQAYRLGAVRRQNNPAVFAILDGKTAQVQMFFGLLCAAAFFMAHYFPFTR